MRSIIVFMFVIFLSVTYLSAQIPENLFNDLSQANLYDESFSGCLDFEGLYTSEENNSKVEVYYSDSIRLVVDYNTKDDVMRIKMWLGRGYLSDNYSPNEIFIVKGKIVSVLFWSKGCIQADFCPNIFVFRDDKICCMYYFEGKVPRDKIACVYSYVFSNTIEKEIINKGYPAPTYLNLGGIEESFSEQKEFFEHYVPYFYKIYNNVKQILQ